MNLAMPENARVRSVPLSFVHRLYISNLQARMNTDFPTNVSEIARIGWKRNAGAGLWTFFP